ncbi:MAG: hypothetical protein GX146_11085 [Myxococcales bacterium]|nr:hypothetical protein [Myxococcales bacterium]
MKLWHWWLCAGLWVAGCQHPAWAPMQQGALFRGQMTPAFGPSAHWRGGDADAPSASARPSSTVREKMVAAAQQWSAQTGAVADFGESDVRRIAHESANRAFWQAGAPVSQWVEGARQCHAYETKRLPSPGDVVLFHNQYDQNVNSHSDDWYTGCAIVTSVRGAHIEAVTRTGNEPRRIHLWLDGPAVHTHKGRVVNSFVRTPRRSDPADAEYLAARLYAGFIDIDRQVDCTASAP